MFLDEINDSDVILQIEDIITAEFLRGAKNFNQAQSSIDYITALLGDTFDPNNYLATTTQDIIEAQIISNINNNVDPNYSSKVSLADSILVAKLSRISETAGLFLCTFNHQDFIPPIMDRIQIINITTPKRVLPLGIYKFNRTVYQAVKKQFGY